jgi:hypothetical protein
MIHTIAFAKWFLNKHRASGILVDGADFEFILSQLDQSSWDEFIATSDSIAISKTTADTLIPQLVEKMPKKPRVKKDAADPEKKKEPKPKGKKTKVDAQTSTDINTPVLENGEAVVEQPLLKKEVKKRAPKAAKKIEEVVVPANTEEVLVVSEQPLLKEVKKRAPKAAKKIEEAVVPANTEEEEVPVVEVPMKKEIKKRAPKAAKKIEEAVVPANTEEEEVPLPVVEVPMKKEVKKRGPKKTEVVVAVAEEKVLVEQQINGVQQENIEKPAAKKRGPKTPLDNAKPEQEKDQGKKIRNKKITVVPDDDVVVPIKEQHVLDDLQEDQYQDEIELTEVFVDDVLFYKDANGNCFDATLNPVSKF